MRRRWAVRVGVSLIGGFTLNVLVAWGIAIFLTLPDPFASTQPTANRSWVRSVPASLGEPSRALLMRNAVGSHWQLQWDGPDMDAYTQDAVSNVMRHGFPLRTLETQGLYVRPNASFEYDGPLIRGHLPMPPGRDQFLDVVRRVTGIEGPYAAYLPWLPVWEGLIANTIIYAGLILLTWLGLGRWQRRRRVRRGLCPKCAYDLSGADMLKVCPECGTRVTSEAEPKSA